MLRFMTLLVIVMITLAVLPPPAIGNQNVVMTIMAGNTNVAADGIGPPLAESIFALGPSIAQIESAIEALNSHAMGSNLMAPKEIAENMIAVVAKSESLSDLIESMIAALRIRAPSMTTVVTSNSLVMKT